MFIYPYSEASNSARALAAGLGIKRIKLEGSKFKGGPNKTVINWGASAVSDEVHKCKIINHPIKVARATNKLEFFTRLKDKGHDSQAVKALFSKEEAIKACTEGATIVCRTVLNGHSGNGIVLAEKPEDVVDAKLYTVYTPKKSEYRVHVFKSTVIDIQRKARDRGVPDDKVNWKVRNHGNGFIYVRDVIPENALVGVRYTALLMVALFGLHFGAVDVIWNEKQQKAYALEINTAPGLEGTTLEKYIEAFQLVQVDHE